MIDFPANPTVGQQFTAAGATWVWDGVKWTTTNTAAAGGGYLPLTGGSMTGPLNLAADPVNALQAATKEYVDANGGAVTLSATPPLNARAGALWWDTVSGSLFVWYDDGTSAQWVAASNGSFTLPNYLPLTGGTLTGDLEGTTATFSSNVTVDGTIYANTSMVITRAAGQNANLIFNYAPGLQAGNLYYDMPSNSFYMLNSLANDSYLMIDGAGTVNASGSIVNNGNVLSAGQIDAANNFKCRQGVNGATSNGFNFYWTGAALQGWVDTTNQGDVMFNSDYRIKKDIAPLENTWERVKALKPISYSHKDYTPPNAKQPLFRADDIERWGFIAHELQETLTESAATGFKDSPIHVQSPNPWTVIAALTKTLQEAMARVEVLEAARGT